MAGTAPARLQVLTANRLGSGEVVYAGPRGWTEDFTRAQVLATEEAAETRLEAALADVRACRIVEPYLFGVEKAGGGLRPLSVRETIRAFGPSVACGSSNSCAE